jgi:rhamnosyltransferase
MYKVLVILAYFNGEKYIEEQLTSILYQINCDIDIFIFDDFSNDNLYEALKKFDKYSNIRLIKNEVNSQSAAYNFLNSILSINDDILCKYDYIALSDQDDIWLPSKLKRSIDKMLYTNSNLYCSDLLSMKIGNYNIIKKSYNQTRYDFLFEGGSAGCTYVFDFQLLLYLKNCLENLNYLQWPKLNNNIDCFSHDWFIYFIARSNSYKVYIDNEINILYRIHDNNVHGGLNINSFSSFYKRIKLIKDGWYIKQVLGFMFYLEKDTKEYKIYSLYTRNIFTRIYVLLKYNFKLMRSKSKFLIFFIVSLIPQKIKS